MNTEKVHCFMILKQGGMIYVLIWNLFMEDYIAGNECFVRGSTMKKGEMFGFRVRIEMGDDWYLVGLNVSRLDGLRVRM